MSGRYRKTTTTTNKSVVSTRTGESVGKGIGHFFGAMEIDGFEDVDVFKKRIDHWIEVFRNTKPIPGRDAVLIPGDPEYEAEKERTTGGIPVIQSVIWSRSQEKLEFLLRAPLKTFFLLASSLPFSVWRRITEVFRDALKLK